MTIRFYQEKNSFINETLNYLNSDDNDILLKCDMEENRSIMRVVEQDAFLGVLTDIDFEYLTQRLTSKVTPGSMYKGHTTFISGPFNAVKWAKYISIGSLCSPVFFDVSDKYNMYIIKIGDCGISIDNTFYGLVAKHHTIHTNHLYVYAKLKCPTNVNIYSYVKINREGYSSINEAVGRIHAEFKRQFGM